MRRRESLATATAGMMQSRSLRAASTKNIRPPDIAADGDGEPYPVNTRATYRTTKAAKTPRRPTQTPSSKLWCCIISGSLYGVEKIDEYALSTS